MDSRKQYIKSLAKFFKSVYKPGPVFIANYTPKMQLQISAGRHWTVIQNDTLSHRMYETPSNFARINYFRARMARLFGTPFSLHSGQYHFVLLSGAFLRPTQLIWNHSFSQSGLSQATIVPQLTPPHTQYLSSSSSSSSSFFCPLDFAPPFGCAFLLPKETLPLLESLSCAITSPGGRLPFLPARALSGQKNDDEEDEDEERYCVCGGVSWGTMVACDNPDCEKEWFHISCVGLKKAPDSKTKWYCPECKEKGVPTNRAMRARK